MRYLNHLIANGADKEQLWAEFERIAAELDGCLCRRIPLELARRFSYCLPMIRAYVPDATRFGTFAVLLKLAGTLAEKSEGIAILTDKAPLSMPLPAVNEANTEDCLCGLLDGDCAAEFVETVMRIRAVRPNATTYGVFLALLSWSVAFVEKPANLKGLLSSRHKAVRSVKAKAARPGVRGV